EHLTVHRRVDRPRAQLYGDTPAAHARVADGRLGTNQRIGRHIRRDDSSWAPLGGHCEGDRPRSRPDVQHIGVVAPGEMPEHQLNELLGLLTWNEHALVALHPT